MRRRPRAAVAMDVEPHKTPEAARAKLCLAVQSAFSQRAAASALSSGRVLNAIAASGAALAVNFAKLPELLRRKD